jgi:hypothetical protein
MTPSAWLVRLTDLCDDPVLVNLALVTSIIVHENGSTCVTFVSRDWMLVQEPVDTIATLIAAPAARPAADEETP